MPLIQLDRSTGLAVNVAEISHMMFTQSNGDNYLVITLCSGKELRVQHWPYNGTNIWELHRQILALSAQAEAME
ncbi:hypothetical protein [Pseudomonas sp. AN-1]|uniref:hypothetical protein n=1 Tax=Pseudomonas sp. AN-1 TaxID=3096605 RepID=UPI002A69C4F8|nr:hypothetical protein [Pseudomonas sp. AN-1]WPP47105.1 hypothetical protein SK095_06860 [Pseudomonas sp. AN-1]